MYFTCSYKSLQNRTQHEGGVTLSYDQNSGYQESAADIAKSIIEDEISKKVDVEKLLSTKPSVLCIADFGCATGRNSFTAIQTIITAVEKKLVISENTPDFQVFFSDQVKNDFNTLFTSLPPERRYHAAGVPGSFHGRLFPRDTIHFAYTAWSLQCLSRLPDAATLTDPTWNKWKVYCQGGGNGNLTSAYSQQFENDIKTFLNARAQELVVGGLLTLIVPAVPDSINPDTDDIHYPEGFHVLGFCLEDMANEGIISGSKLKSFNFPMYFPKPQELRAIIECCPSFALERLEILDSPGRHTKPSVKVHTSVIRSGLEALFISAFGSEILDELFERFANKIASWPIFENPDNDRNIVLLAVLSRK